VKRKVYMTKDELYEALSLIDHVYTQSSAGIGRYGMAGTQRGRGMLKVACILTVSKELKGTPAEAFINRAGKFAGTMDESKVDIVCELLRETKKYLEEQGHVTNYRK
jgi:hypothetical protein